MPIRRAAATPTQEKAPSAAAEKEPEASEESPSADEEPAASSAAAAETKEGESEAAATGDAEPTENGEQKADGEAGEEKGGKGTEKKDEKCKDCGAGQCATHCYVLLLRLKDGYKYEKAKVKKVKRTIPAWASVASSKKLPVTNFAGTQNKVDNILIEAITSCNDKSGVSYQSVMKFIGKKYPDMELDRKKFLIKKAMKKHLEKGTIKQLKGKGLSGTFAIGKQTASSKKAGQKQESLGDALPLIITRLCEPKEASYNLIKKYLEQHFPNFNIENRPDVLKTALLKAVEKGQLEQITGKGARGTFQLKRIGNQVLLKGSTLEDAITAAITAMNEPKTCSTTTLRRYLVDANKDRKENQLVASLRRTLTKCKVLGWMEQITGHGFTGTYRLSFPFYPSPTILYPDKFLPEPEKKNAATPSKRRRTADSSDEEESSSSEEEEDEDDEPPSRRRKSQKRPPPKARRPPPAKKSRSSSQSKAKGRGRSLAKKSPAKKVVKRLGKKETTTPPKATPVKRGAPARKPKTPVVKKLNKRATKRPVSRESSPEEAVVTKETTRVSKRSRAEESTPEKPAAKKAATKGGSRRPEPEESSPKAPVVKKAAKGVKKTTRKSKRGRN
ncbi:heterochromatin protein 1-binding protein 3 isoform X1 [Hippoglossus stenolepis]|uniref:heterochromatin protein 1-binding protein 3 isoform X1 n=1 Tax=Hippoglossus stenolepis TaxID=195615 RepID=UPI001FAF1845|nr:heterochromatin protein 1-binding protein 3 isoform X1 [Hippoglossus stenolepis]